MEPQAWIAAVSIFTAGLTIGIGAIGPALGEGRALAEALRAIAQQPDETSTIVRTLFVGLAMIESTAIYCFVVSMIVLFWPTRSGTTWSSDLSDGTALASGVPAKLIDWFTVGAQIANFLILLALLKWLLFDRIVSAMDRREETIAGRLQEAERKEAEARKEKEQLAEDRRSFDSQRRKRLDEARDEADRQRDALVREAREDVARLEDEWRENLKRQQQQWLRELSEQAAKAFRNTVEKALADLAGTAVQDAATRAFLQNLGQTGPDSRSAIAEAVETADGEIVVASAAELPDALRRDVTETFNHVLQRETEPEFESAPELIAGLEVRFGGRAWGWNLRRYLDQFEERMEASLQEESESITVG